MVAGLSIIALETLAFWRNWHTPYSGAQSVFSQFLREENSQVWQQSPVWFYSSLLIINLGGWKLCSVKKKKLYKQVFFCDNCTNKVIATHLQILCTWLLVCFWLWKVLCFCNTKIFAKEWSLLNWCCGIFCVCTRLKDMHAFALVWLHWFMAR